MNGEIQHAFATPIARFQVPESEAAPVNAALKWAILDMAQTYPSLGKSNIGGWRSRNDLLFWPVPEIRQLNDWIMTAVKEVVEATAGPVRFKGQLKITGWASVCRKGDYNAPHVHPESAWSGVYYVDPGTRSDDHPVAGQLEFLDPRGRAEMAATPGDPFGDPVRIDPRAGLMVLFPSWLYHWVHPYASEGTRIAISFNVAVKAEVAG
jgi:uncharacterized protein (TIGR02466 family)